MGTIITDSSCEEGVTLEWRQNGPDAVPVPGLYVVITGPDGELGPLPTKGIIDVEPNANYVVEYILTDGHADGRDMVWGTHPVTTPGLPTDCTVDEPTTTTPSPAPTAPPEVTESTTALAPPSTIATAIDMDVDPCVTSATGCTVAVGVPPTLPATGATDITGPLAVSGSMVIAAGLLMAWGARHWNRKVTS
jgi:hypothetical protein